MADKLYDSAQQEINLTEEQKECVQYTGNRTLFVKGLAGSGKSVVLTDIAKKYIAKYGTEDKNKVAIFTFQNTLVTATKENLFGNACDDCGILVSTIDAHVKTIYQLLVDKGIAPKQKYHFEKTKSDKAQRLKNVETAIKEHQKKYGRHRFHLLDYEFWLSEFDWMKGMNVWYDDLEYYIELPRKGRGFVHMKSAERLVAYQLYMCYCEHLDKTGQGDWIDQTLFLIRHSDEIPEAFKYDHILVDEAQDLSLAQMKLIMLLFKKDMCVAMDANQKIHEKYWTPKMIGMEGTTKKLTQSMRTTVQIDALAESVRGVNDSKLTDDDKVLRAIPKDDTGPLPKLVCLEDQASERRYVLNLVKSYLKAYPKFTIAIIAAKKTQILKYSDWLASENIEFEIVTRDSTFSVKKPGVKVVSAYGAKGLEFNAVIIPNFAEGYFPYNFKTDDEELLEAFLIKMRNLVYVSMTRAKKFLTITWWGSKGSRFIADMDKELYIAEGKPFDIKPYKMPKSVVKVTNESKPNFPKVGIKQKRQERTKSLVEFLEEKGLKIVDKRSSGGNLWVIGGKELDPQIKEVRKIYSALWSFSEKGNSATAFKPGWYTKSTK